MSDMEKGLELSVQTVPVTVTSNIDDVVAFVTERIKDYEPDKYIGDISAARKDRAELVKGAEKIARRRIDIGKEILAPYAPTEEKAKKAEKLIKQAIAKIDLVIESKEEADQAERDGKLLAYFSATGFLLVTFEKIKATYAKADGWYLAKTTVPKAVEALNARIREIREGIETIESLGSSPEIIQTVKVLYLDSLDLSAAIRKNKELADAAARIAAEASRSTGAVASGAKVMAQADLEVEKEREQDGRHVESLAAAAGGDAPVDDPVFTYTIKLTCSRSKKDKFKQFLIDEDIAFTQVMAGEK